MSEIAEILSRIWENLGARPDGPLALRFYLQPTMATLLALRDGLKDARSDRTPYFWTIVFNAEERAGRVREGLKAVAKLMTVAVLLDVVYQWQVLGTFYPGEALVVAFLLGYIPYLILRGPIARIARRMIVPKRATGGS